MTTDAPVLYTYSCGLCCMIQLSYAYDTTTKLTYRYRVRVASTTHCCKCENVTPLADCHVFAFACMSACLSVRGTLWTNFVDFLDRRYASLAEINFDFRSRSGSRDFSTEFSSLRHRGNCKNFARLSVPVKVLLQIWSFYTSFLF